MAAQLVTSLCSMVSNHLMTPLEGNTYEAPDSLIRLTNVLVLDESVELLTGTMIGSAILPHDGALSDRASLAEKLLQLDLVNIPRQVCDIKGLSVNFVLLKELLVGVPGWRDQTLLLVIGMDLVLGVLLRNLKNRVSIWSRWNTPGMSIIHTVPISRAGSKIVNVAMTVTGSPSAF